VSPNIFRSGVVLATVAALLAGCGSNGDGGSPSSSASAGSSQPAAAELKALAATKLAEVSSPPASWPGPKDAVAPGTGSAAVIACGFFSEACKNDSDSVVEAFKSAGWDATAYDGKADPKTMGALVDQAIQDKRRALVVVLWDVNTFAAAIDRAVAAGIKIACVLCNSGDKWKGKVTDVTVNFQKTGEQLGWAILARSGSAAKVAEFVDKNVPISLQDAAGVEKTIKENCSTCEVSQAPFATLNATQPGPPEMTALLASKPKGSLTDVVPHYTGVGLPAAKTAQQAGRTELGFFTWGSGSDVEAALKTQNPPLHATVGEPQTYASWVAVDVVFRLVAGVALWDGYDALPSVIITPQNIGQNPKADPAPSGDWKSGLKKIWGAS
jgi:ABC-type sugar transport system substrate-binding protein